MKFERRHMLQTASVLAGGALLRSQAASRVGENEHPSGVSPSIEPVDLLGFEPLARARMPSMVWEYVSGGAGDEVSLGWNREGFRRIRLQPHSLEDVSQLDTRVKLFGMDLPHPILLAPTAYHRLVHPEGELATVRGAGTAEAILIVSTMATTKIEEIAAAASQPFWFQLYVQEDRTFTRDLVQRAEAAGSQALVVTVDAPVAGFRYREMRVKFALPSGIECPQLKGLKSIASTHLPMEQSIYSSLLNPKLTWKEIDWLLSFARIPVLLKGILNPADAERAVQAGVAGIIVSNHGARNLDTLPSTIDVLPGVVARVDGRLPVLVDGGLRRGTDVLKALALGAKAILIGRPYLFGLGAAGSMGVTRVINILRKELETAMALTGRTSISGIDRSLIFGIE